MIDSIGESSLEYEKILKESGIQTKVKSYEDAKHRFIEENNLEYEKLHKKNRTSKSSEAEMIAREAEDFIKEWINKNKQ